jgi:alanine-synthesizing transaminase
MRFSPTTRERDLISGVTRLASGRLCSSTLAQYAIQPALQGEQKSVAEFRDEIQRRRDFAVARVAEIEGISCTTPEAAFYLMVHVEDMGGRTDEQFVLDLLESSNVLVVHGSGFGCDPKDGYFRLVYLPDEQLLGAAFDGIERSLRVLTAVS